MKNIIKFTFVVFLFVASFATVYSTTANTAFAVAGGGGDGGCCGGGGSSGGGSGGGSDNGSDPIIPVCTLRANAATIDKGESSNLSWTTSNAIFASINQGIGEVARPTGNRNVSPVETKTFTMTVRSISGVTRTCAATVTVRPPVVPAPVCDLNASPATIDNGGTSQLSWTSQNAVSAVLNTGIGAVNLNGNRNVSPSVTTEYVLTVKNSANVEKVCKATVTVKPIPEAPVCDFLSANPTTINRGQSSQLSWGTTNATAVAINNGVGAVAVDGSTSVSPLETTTYTLTASGANNQTDTCTRTITVVQPEVKVPRCEYFNASATTIRRGDTVTLSWDTTNVTAAVINPGVGSVAVDGSTSVSPSETTTYTLSLTGSDNQTASCTRTVTVETSGGGGGGSSSPKCSLKISDNKITRGDRITLKWDTSRATEVTLKDNHGKTLVSTDDAKKDDKKDLYDGEITLRPEKDTTYTLIAERGSKDRTCKVSVDVKDGVTVLENRDQKPVVSGISLTQVPYTGFEAGPFLTMVFYGLLLLWALYLAYVLVVRKQGGNSMVVATATPVPVAPAPAMSEVATPRFVAATPVAPVVTPVVGYAAAASVPVDTAYEAVAAKVEDAAHAERVLVSSEAMRHFILATTEDNRVETLAAVLAKAKASYPSEDGWVVLNIDRMKSVTTAIAPVVSVFTPRSVAA